LASAFSSENITFRRLISCLVLILTI